MKPVGIDPNMTVDEIMRRWPDTIRVFIRNRMFCIGCPVGVFHTMKDACAAHDLEEETLSQELLAAMQSDNAPSAFENIGSLRSHEYAGRNGQETGTVE
jgi:hybrid cluster-associated redox disulfide protein